MAEALVSNGTPLFREVPKPFLTAPDDVRTLLLRLFGVRVSTIEEFDSYDDRIYHVTTDPGQGIGDNTEFIFNVLNAGLTAGGAVESQTDVLDFLWRSFPELQCQAPVPNLKGELVSFEKIRNDYQNGSQVRSEAAVSALRLFIYLPGSTILSSSPMPLSFFQKVGIRLGDLQNALQKYPKEIDVHPLKQRATTTIWCLENISYLRSYLHVVKDAKALKIVNEVITEYERKVIPVYGELRKGIVHQDFSDCNVLAAHPLSEAEANWDKNDYEISGVIDFNDMVFSCLVFDVAVAMMYFMFCSDEPLAATANLLAGFESRAPLPDKERGVLRALIAGRFTQSLVLGLFFAGLNPNNLYIQQKQEKGWSLLELFWNHPEDELMKLWNGSQGRSC